MENGGAKRAKPNLTLADLPPRSPITAQHISPPAFEFPGYRHVQHYAINSPRVHVFMAYSIHRRRNVWIKTCAANLYEITKLRYEYKILTTLPEDIHGIVRPIDIESTARGLLVIFPYDASIVSLRNLFLSASNLTVPPEGTSPVYYGSPTISQSGIVAVKVPIPRFHLLPFLFIAHQMANILLHLHQHHVIHKDISPNVISIDTRGRVKLSNFIHASRLEREMTTVSLGGEETRGVGGPSGMVEGTLAYLAPENTGRMNRIVDKRCDFYALGCTFYEIITGRLPFLATDPLQLMHQHIAEPVVSPHTLISTIPRPISDMVCKLMAKSPEERYQSAEGLKADIEELWKLCTDQKIADFCWRDSLDEMDQAHVSAKFDAFRVGEWDHSSQFTLPQKLFGRQREVDVLLASFASVKEERKRACVIVRGYSGVGKTALIQEVQRPVIEARGYFTMSKFDQFQRDIPFVSIIQAVRDLVRQLLSESAQALDQWRLKMTEAVGADGKVVTDVVPELTSIIGPQPDVPILGPAENEARFTRVLMRLLGVFGQDSSLVLFLDDLHWSSESELNLLKKILYNPETSSILLIGAYRSNEVDPTHSLVGILESIEMERRVPLHVIDLEPLDLTSVNDIVCATLSVPHGGPEEDIEEKGSSYYLSRLIYDKTKGYPFFVLQLLKLLYREGFLTFDFATKRWTWDIQTIIKQEISPNVVELVSGQIKQLPARTQNVMRLASCIGNRFTSDVLSVVNEKDLITTMSELWDALLFELIIPLDQKYKIPLAYVQSEQKSDLKMDVWNALIHATSGATGESQPLKRRDSSSSGRADEFLSHARRIPFHVDPATGECAVSDEDIVIQFRFLHDRVQQAAYMTIPDDERQRTHLKIGFLLLQFVDEESSRQSAPLTPSSGISSESTPSSQRQMDFMAHKIFDIVNQLNAGAQLLIQEYERKDVVRAARLNLMASAKAKSSSAFEAAYKYVEMGLLFLRGIESADLLAGLQDAWEKEYDLTSQLCLELADVQYAMSMFEPTKKTLTVMRNKTTLLEKRGQISERYLKCYTAEGRVLDAMDTGTMGLRDLGLPIPDSPEDCDAYCQRLSKDIDAIPTAQIKQLANLPIMSDPTNAQMMKILITLIPPTYFGKPGLLGTIIFSAVDICIKYGLLPESAYAFCLYGLMLSGKATDLEDAYQASLSITNSYEFGKLAITCCSLFPRTSIKCPVYKVYASHIQCWNEPLRNCMPNFKVAIQEGISTANGEYTGYAGMEYCVYLMYAGEELETVLSSFQHYTALVRRFKQEIGNSYISIGHQFVLNLKDRRANQPEVFAGPIFSEKEHLLIVKEKGWFLNMLLVYHFKAFLCWLYRKKEEALTWSRLAMEHLVYGVGTLYVGHIMFYHALILLDCARDQPLEEADKKQVKTIIDKIHVWSKHAPTTFAQKHQILQGLTTWVVDGTVLEAMDEFDGAITTAKEHGILQDAAIANELAAEMFYARKRMRVGDDYLVEAYYGYMQWGATAKTRDLTTRYNRLYSILSSNATALGEQSDLTKTFISPSTGTPTMIGSSSSGSSYGSLPSTILIPNKLGTTYGNKFAVATSRSGTDMPDDDNYFQAAPGYMNRRSSDISLRHSRLVSSSTQPYSPGAGRMESTVNTYVELDLNTVMQASLVISEEIQLDELIDKLMRILLQTAGAERAVLLLDNDGELFIEASAAATVNPSKVVTRKQSSPLEDCKDEIPVAIINYVARTKNSIINTSAQRLPLLTNEPYMIKHSPKSLLCTPIMHQGRLVGLLYLENNQVFDGFTQERIDILQLLSSQAAISIQKARLYKELEDANESLRKSQGQIEEYNRTLEEKVRVRTNELMAKNDHLKQEIAERQKAEEEMRKAKDYAEQATQMKSSFLANMSHEIRTPFNAVIGMTGLLQESGLNAVQMDYVATIRSSSGELLHLINDILDFSKIETGKLDLEFYPFSLRTCIEGALDVLSSKSALKGLELAYWNRSGDETLNMILGDSIRFRQIVINLLSNAVKFTEVGQVIISTELYTVEEAERRGLMNSDPSHSGSSTSDWIAGADSKFANSTTHIIYVSVADTGIGIPKERFDRLFRLFSQVDPSISRTHGGTGLGLNISERLCKLMGGRMWVESELGKGSIFHFTVRTSLVPESSSDNTNRNQEGRLKLLKSRKCLVVEDNATNQMILKQQVEEWGLKTMTINNAHAAMDIVRSDDKVNIVIVDAILDPPSAHNGWKPGADGLELIRRIRERESTSEIGHSLEILLMIPVGFNIGQDIADLKIAAVLTKPVKRGRLWSSLYDAFLQNDAEHALPASVPPSNETRPGIPLKLVDRTGPLTILITEDNPVNQKVAVQILRKMGFDADLANDGQMALDSIAKKSYDIVFMDVNMPNMDGLTATRILCDRYSKDKRPVIIAMTANAMRGDKDMCMQAGCDGYIAKPIVIAELVNALKKTAALKYGAISLQHGSNLLSTTLTSDDASTPRRDDVEESVLSKSVRKTTRTDNGTTGKSKRRKKA